MKYLMLLMTILPWLLVNSTASASLSNTAKITLKVVDGQGTPMEGVSAGATFETQRTSGFGIDYQSKEGLTDSNGVFIVENEILYDVAFVVEKEGYYRSKGRYTFRKFTLGHAQPWNPTVELVMRKIENPVPMYERNTKMFDLNIPVTGKEVGFDLMKYDWLPPHGSGVIADFIFKLEKRYTNIKDFDAQLTITFSNKFDGIQLHKDDRKNTSAFKLPRYAPEKGYKNKLLLKSRRTPGKSKVNDAHDDNNYFSRVRSEVEDGKLVRAMYGKITGPIVFRRFVQVDPQLK